MSTTPNIDLTLPAAGSLNWGVPTLNNNLSKIDSVFGGAIQIPSIWPQVIVGLAAIIGNLLVSENVAGAGGPAGTHFPTSQTISALIGVFYNGSLLRQGTDYSYNPTTIIPTFAISATDDLRPVYLKLS